MTKFARNLCVFTPRIPTDFSAILLTRWNGALAWDAGELFGRLVWQ